MSAALRPSKRAAALAAVLFAALTPAAQAVPATGPVENPNGATVAITPSPAAPGSVISFSGTGFNAGESVSVKVDDGKVIKKGGGEVFTVAPVQAGAIAGSVDLSNTAPGTPIEAGEHSLRFLSSARSFSVKFTVAAPAVDPGDSANPGNPDPGAPTVPGTPTPTPTTPGVYTPTPDPKLGPTIVKTGPMWMSDTIVKRSKSKKKLVIKLQANGLGSSGTLSIRSKDKFKIGKGKAKTRTIAKKAPYFLDKAGADSFNVTLTADGLTLIKRKKELKAIVTLVDANGEDRVKQEIWIRR